MNRWLWLLIFIAYIGLVEGLTVVGQCGTGNSANETYRLNQSITSNGSTCFTAGANNITLDCAGYSITGNDTANTYGINTNGKSNVTIANCTISGYAIGIYLNLAQNNTVSNNTVNGSKSAASSRAISVNQAHGANISSNIIYAFTNAGISMSNNPGNLRISNNTIYLEGRTDGIGSAGTSALTSWVFNNTVISTTNANSSAVGAIGGPNNWNIYDNNISIQTASGLGCGGTQSGILVGSNNNVYNNTVVYNHTGADFCGGFSGILVSSSTGNSTVYNNTVTVNTNKTNQLCDGFLGNLGTYNVSVYNNTFRALCAKGYGYNTGTSSTRSYNFTVFNNVFEGNQIGIKLHYLDNATFYDNNITKGTHVQFNDTYIGDNTNATFLNMSFTTTNQTFEDNTNRVTFQWYLQTHVTDSLSASLQSAVVNVTTATGTLLASQATDSNGNTTLLNVTSWQRNLSATTNYTPHNFTVTYNSAYTSVNYTITQNTYPTIQLTLSACGAISANTTLLNNVSSSGNCFTSSTNDISLDCNGFYITGNASGTGVNFTGARANVSNCFIQNYSTGIYVFGSSSLVKNNSVINSTSIGVEARGSSTVVYNNTIDNANDTGIYVAGSSTNVSLNIVKNSGDSQNASIFASGLSTKVYNNTLFAGNGGGINFSAGSNASYNNVSYHSSGSGIVTQTGSTHTIHDNLLAFNSIGLSLAGANSSAYANNVSYNTQSGIRATDVNASVYNNIFTGNNNGLLLNSTNSTAYNNTIQSTTNNGVEFYGTNNNVWNNTINVSKYSVVFNSTSNNTVENSTLSSPGTASVHATGNSNNSLVNTNFTKANATFGDSVSNFSVKWFATVRVVDNSGSVKSGVLVTVRQSDGVVIKNATTGSSGIVDLGQVTEFYSKQSGITNYTPHNVTTTYLQYVDSTNVTFDSSKQATVTTQVPSCSSLTSNLTLAENVTAGGTCFTLGANSITIDCSGYTIIGNGSGHAVNTGGFDNAVIKNCLITNFTTGVFSTSSDFLNVSNTTITSSSAAVNLTSNTRNATLFNNTFSSNTYGVYVFSSTGTLFENSSIASSTTSDVYAIGSSNIDLVNSSFTSSKLSFGDSSSNVSVKWFFFVMAVDKNRQPLTTALINVTNSKNTLLYSNSVDSNGRAGLGQVTEYMKNQSGTYNYSPFNVTAYSGSVSNSTLHFPTESGAATIQLTLSYCETLTSNTTLLNNVSSSGTCLVSTANDIALNCNGFYIIGNTSGLGVNFTGARANVSNCFIQNYSTGILLSGANSTIRNTTILNNSGIGVNTTGAYSVVTNNTVVYNPTGVSSSGQNTVVYSNNVSYNDGFGVEATAANIDFYLNTIIGNQKGMRLNSTGARAYNNTIQSNTLGGLEFAGQNNTAWNNTLASNNYSIIFTTAPNNVVENSSMASPTTGHIYASGGSSNNSIVNTNFTKTSITVADSASNISVKWFASVRVIDSNNVLRSGVLVTVKQSDGTTVLNTTTGASGVVELGQVTEYVARQSGITNYTPHNVSSTYLSLVNSTNFTIDSSKQGTIMTQVPTCTSITSNLTLSENLSSNGTCMTFAAHGVELDCSGFTISGNSSGYGINTNGFDNLSVKNCSITNYSAGVFSSGSDYLLVSNTTVSSSSVGINLTASTRNASLYNNTLSSNTYGVFLTASTDTNIENTTFVSSTTADMHSTSSSNSNLTNSTFSQAKLTYGDSSSNTTVKWFLTARVIDLDGLALSGALVNVTDAFGRRISTGNTTSTGNAYLGSVEDYVKNQSGVYNYSPLNVTAYKTTAVNSTTRNHTQSGSVTIQLIEASIAFITPSNNQVFNQGDSVSIQVNETNLQSWIQNITVQVLGDSSNSTYQATHNGDNTWNYTYNISSSLNPTNLTVKAFAYNSSATNVSINRTIVVTRIPGGAVGSPVVNFFCSNHTYLSTNSNATIVLRLKLDTLLDSITTSLSLPNSTLVSLTPVSYESSQDNTSYYYNYTYRYNATTVGTHGLQTTVTDVNGLSSSATQSFYSISPSSLVNLTLSGAASINVTDKCSGELLSNGSSVQNLLAGNYTLNVSTSKPTIALVDTQLNSGSSYVVVTYTDSPESQATPPSNRRTVEQFELSTSLNFSHALVQFNYSNASGTLVAENSLEARKCSDSSNCSWQSVSYSLNTTGDVITVNTSNFSLFGIFEPAYPDQQNNTITVTQNIGGGTQYITQEVLKEVIREQTRLVTELKAFRIISTPAGVSVAVNGSTEIPVIIQNNENIELRNIRLSAESESKDLDLDLGGSEIIERLAPGEQITRTLKVTTHSQAGLQEVMIKASANEGGLEDYVKVAINLVDEITGNKVKSDLLVSFATDLFNENADCLELMELVQKASAALEAGDYVTAESLSTNAISGCRTLLSAKKEQICTPDQRVLAQTGFAAGFLSLEWFILLISLICLAIVYLFTRNKRV